LCAGWFFEGKSHRLNWVWKARLLSEVECQSVRMTVDCFDGSVYGEVRLSTHLGAKLCSSFKYSMISSRDFFSSMYIR
jgi:hypothetical protein